MFNKTKKFNKITHKDSFFSQRVFIIMAQHLTGNVFPQRFKRFAVLLAHTTLGVVNRMARDFHVLHEMFLFLVLFEACRALVSGIISHKKRPNI